MIRGQLCLYQTTSDAHGWCASGGVGLIQAPVGSLEDERIMPFVSMDLGGAHLIATGDYSRHRVADAGHELAGHVRNAQWPRPVAGSGQAGGGMLFRRTRIPAPEGHETMTVAICMYAPRDAVVSQVRYDLSGDPRSGGRPERMSMHSPRAFDGLARYGIGMDALLKQPAWGWSDEPFAMQSTMRLDVIDDAMESRRLLDLPHRTPAQDDRLAELRGTYGYDLVAHDERREPEFAEFRRRMGSHAPFDDWTATVTARQLHDQESRAEEIVRSLLRRRRAA